MSAFIPALPSPGQSGAGYAGSHRGLDLLQPMAGQSQWMFVGMTALIGAGVGVLLGVPLLMPAAIGAVAGYVVGLSETGGAGSFLDKYGGDERRLLSRRNVTYLSAAAAGLLVARYAGFSLLLGAGAGLAAGYFVFKDTRY